LNRDVTKDISRARLGTALTVGRYVKRVIMVKVEARYVPLSSARVAPSFGSAKLPNLASSLAHAHAVHTAWIRSCHTIILFDYQSISNELPPL